MGMKPRVGTFPVAIFGRKYHEEVVLPYREKPFWHAEAMKVIELLAEDLKSGWSMDVGCDDGAFADLVRIHGDTARSDGLDVNAFAVAQGRARHPNVYLRHYYSGLVFPALDAIYNTVTCMHTLGHVTSPLAFLVECHRILWLEGKLAVLVPNKAYYKAVGTQDGDATQVHQFDGEELLSLVNAAGFKGMHLMQFGDTAPGTKIQSRLIVKAVK